jgi:hypothetical protein
MNKTENQKNNYIFIDFENVQPSNLDSLKNFVFKVFVFVGASQTKVPIELVLSMQDLGENAKYIMIDGNGKNALDFHITFYLGQIYEKEPEGYFHIISKDTGFDILINHLKKKGVSINRYCSIAEIPVIGTLNCSKLGMMKKIDLIKSYLISRGNAKPKKIISLRNTINSLCHRTLEDNELDEVINIMIKENLFSLNDNIISYSF